MTKHNDPVAALRERAEELAVAVDAFVAIGDIKDDAQATRAGDLQRELQALEKKVEEERKREKQPHLDSAKAVDSRYTPIRDVTQKWRRTITDLLGLWLRRQREEQQEKARKAREAADVAAREAAAAQSEIDRAELAAEAERAKRAAERAASERPHVGSQVGGRRAISIRQSPPKVRIVDETVAAGWCWGTHRAEMLELITRMASADARAGTTEIPGCEIYREETTA